MSGGFIPNDPRLGLAIVTFRDELGAGEDPNVELGKDPAARRGRTGEQQAAAFWLEHRNGPAGRSLSDMGPRIGRSLSTIDVAGSVEAIGRCLEVVPASWRAVTVVAAGWRVGVEQLRNPSPKPPGKAKRAGPPYLERAGLPTELPMGLSRHTLNVRIRAFREALIQRRIVIGAERDLVADEPTFAPPRPHPIRGWAAIAEYLGATERTAQRWLERGLPVQQTGRGATVWAFADELDAWLRAEGFRKTA